MTTCLVARRVLMAKKGLGHLVGLNAPKLECDWILDERGQPVGYVPARNPGANHPIAKLALRRRNVSLGAAIRNTIREEMAMEPYEGAEIFDLTGALRASSSGDQTADAMQAFAAAARGEGTMAIRLWPRGPLNVFDPSGRQIGRVIYRWGRAGRVDDIGFSPADPESLPASRRRASEPPAVGHVSKGLGKSWPGNVQDVVDRRGATVARLGPTDGASGGSSYWLEKLGPIDEPLDSLLVAYLYALLDREWTASVYGPGRRSEPG